MVFTDSSGRTLIPQEQRIVPYRKCQIQDYHHGENAKHLCSFPFTALPSYALTQTRQTTSSLVVPPGQRPCGLEYLLVKTDFCGQARNLLVVLRVDVCEDGIFALEKHLLAAQHKK